MDVWDVAIIGGGGAGLTAGLYASRANLKTCLFEKINTGGQISLTDDVENYPGFPEGITGPEISMKMEEQAKKYGTVIITEEIKGLEERNSVFVLKTAGKEYFSKTIILASGASPRKVGVPGERELTGKGVSYCATCDGAFFKNKQIVVVGGGDSALQEGLFLTRFASKVNVIHRRDKLRASPILQDRAFKEPKIEFIWDTVVDSIQGANNKVDQIKLKNLKSNEIRDFKTDGVFVFVGHDPETKYIGDFVKLDEKGYVIADPVMMQTSRKGVFAAGEVRTGAVKQLVTACGEGCAAALQAQYYLENLENH